MSTHHLRQVRRRPMIQRAALLVLLAAAPMVLPVESPLLQPARAFLPPVEKVGPLQVEIIGARDVTQLETPMALTARVSNSGAAPLRVNLQFSVADDWSVSGQSRHSFTLGAGENREVPFSVIAGKTSLAALYPVHARAEFRPAGAALSTQAQVAQAIAVVSVKPEAIAARPSAGGAAPTTILPADSALRLDDASLFTTRIVPHNAAPIVKPYGWTGSDETTRADMRLGDMNRGTVKRSLMVHPPWANGVWGDVHADYRLTLPKTTPIELTFATAIRDSHGNEPQSDGVEFRVLIEDESGWKNVFTRFSAAKSWEAARVDLSAYAGKTVTLRLVTNPGPNNDTQVDSAYWGDVILRAGTSLQNARESETQIAARRTLALATARGGQNAQNVFAWNLKNEASNARVAIVPGPQGIADAAIAFVDGERELVFDGFRMEVSGTPVGGASGIAPSRVSHAFANGRLTINHRVLSGGREVTLQTQIWAEKGGLRVAFSMPGAVRDKRGNPRYTKLHIGPASQEVRRVYAGFGNVIQDPGAFTLWGGGFTLSTRHSGFDYRNGLSLVQATDIYPDALDVVPSEKLYAVRTHHDATFTLVPSSKGAFAAARVFRGIAEYSRAAGVPHLLNRVVLDQWGGDYNTATDDLERAARYGLTNTVFVKHVWQRWGYDYRLPDIYPPAGDAAAFVRLANTAKKHGILFAPHDNYIDFYPDASGFSYKHIVFNEDGTPQLAWFNPGPTAQSYRWSPIAFQPWLERNLKLVKSGIAPTSYFVDVFSAIDPFDFYDRSGRFYPKMVTQERWGAAFDRIREVLGNNAPTISEAGTDALIGHLDGAQSDHAGWSPPSQETSPFRWQMPAASAERVPWHDMVSHGNFALLAGGLGSRYATGEENPLAHGYASDDYLSMTVLGGRVPMSDGPFSRGAVMTYWLLHGLSKEMGNREMLTHEFIGDDIHRQRVGFAGNARVIVNRGATDWNEGGMTLPQYGFAARAGEYSADVSRRGGIISAMAQGPGETFVDARSVAALGSNGRVRPRVTNFQDLGGGKFRIEMTWDVIAPMTLGWRPFVHFADPAIRGTESILFQAPSDLQPDTLTTPGAQVKNIIEGQVPENITLGSIAIRHGLYNDTGRFVPFGTADDTSRLRGGFIDIAGAGAARKLTYRAENLRNDNDEIAARLNIERKMVDFGAVVTNGAFRLQHSGSSWTLTPLPDSPPCEVELRLNQLNARGKKIAAMERISENGKVQGSVTFSQNADSVRFTVPGDAFALRLRLAN